MNQTPLSMSWNHHDGEEIALRLGPSVGRAYDEITIGRSWAAQVESWSS